MAKFCTTLAILTPNPPLYGYIMVSMKTLSVNGSSFVERQVLIPFISRTSRNYYSVTVINVHQLSLLLLTLIYTYFPSLSHLFSAGTAQFCSRRLKLNVQLQNSGHCLEVIIVSISTEFNACGLRAVKSLTDDYD